MNIPEKVRNRIYNFNDWYLDTLERKITNGDKLLNLTPKTFDVLQILVENYGEILPKDDILEKVWHKTIVEEGNLPVHIFKLRKALGATKNEPIIETVIGEGYRFVSRVQVVDRDEWNLNLPDFAKVTSKIESDSIAVLPFQNQNGNDEIDYLADGITGSLINKLASQTDLNVRAKNAVFSYKTEKLNIKKVNDELNVDYIVIGRLRVVEVTLIIEIELVKTKNVTQVWGMVYRQALDDVFELQNIIIKEIAIRLDSNYTSSANNGSDFGIMTSDSNSYRHYLMGRYLIEKRSPDSIKRAILNFEKSIADDPKNALSYVGLAECHLWLYYYQEHSLSKALSIIRVFLETASNLNSRFPELFFMKGYVSMQLEWDFKKAESYLMKALSIHPDFLMARFLYANTLTFSGRFSEALEQVRKIEELDPLSVLSGTNIGRIFYNMKRFQEAESKLNEALELEPKNTQTLCLIGCCRIEMGKYEMALESFDVLVSSPPNTPVIYEFISEMGYCYARQGRTTEAKTIVEKLVEMTDSENFSVINLGMIYDALNEIDLAFDCLTLAITQQNSDLVALMVDPRWRNVRKDARFGDIVKKTGIVFA